MSAAAGRATPTNGGAAPTGTDAAPPTAHNGLAPSGRNGALTAIASPPTNGDVIQMGTDTPPSQTNGAPPVFGAVLDSATRCIHFHSELDIVAIKFACCRRYYPCFQCHDEAVQLESVPHTARRWPQSEWSELAILCGACHRELSITEYRQVERCPHCAAEFNPGCRLHAHLYFEESAG